MGYQPHNWLQEKNNWDTFSLLKHTNYKKYRDDDNNNNNNNNNDNNDNNNNDN